MNSRNVLDEHGQVLYSQGSEIDITERKQAEQALQQRARELQLLYETSLEVSAQTSLDKLLLAIVERAASLVGTDGGGLYLMDPDGQSVDARGWTQSAGRKHRHEVGPRRGHFG